MRAPRIENLLSILLHRRHLAGEREYCKRRKGLAPGTWKILES